MPPTEIRSLCRGPKLRYALPYAPIAVTQCRIGICGTCLWNDSFTCANRRCDLELCSRCFAHGRTCKCGDMELLLRHSIDELVETQLRLVEKRQGVTPGNRSVLLTCTGFDLSQDTDSSSSYLQASQHLHRLRARCREDPQACSVPLCPHPETFCAGEGGWLCVMHHCLRQQQSPVVLLSGRPSEAAFCHPTSPLASAVAPHVRATFKPGWFDQVSTDTFCRRVLTAFLGARSGTGLPNRNLVFFRSRSTNRPQVRSPRDRTAMCPSCHPTAVRSFAVV